MLRVGSIGASAGAFPALTGTALAQEDAAALVAASERAAERMAAHAEAVGTGIGGIPEALGQMLAWLASSRSVPQSLLLLLAAMAAAVLAGYLLEGVVRRSWHFARTHRAGALLAALLFPLPTLIVLAFKGSPIRSAALALSLAWGFMHVVDTFLRLLAGRDREETIRKPLHRIRSGLGILAFGYVFLGLLRLAGVEAEPRLALATLLWLGFLGAGFGALGAFRSALPQDWGRPYEAGDVIVRYIRPHWYGVSVFMLSLTGVVTVVASVHHQGAAFVKGAASVLLLGIVLAFLFAKPSVAAEEVKAWRLALRRSARLAAFAGYGIGFALIWNINPLALATDRLGEPFARAVIDIGIACALALMLWELARTALDSYAPAAHADITRSDDQGHIPAATRLQTFLPLLRAATAIFIFSVAGMVILMAMGINIAPMLAGAGVLGIAIGFGSQTLVKDVISGLFFLADDAFRLGEFVEIGNAKGTVEKMSIRSLRLRHPRGQLYTVPFGEIRQITNFSRDYTIVKIEFTIAFDTDLVKAKKIVKQIAAELDGDEEFGSHLLQPLKFQGVRRMEQYGIVVGVKFTAKPGEQWGLQREVYQRVRDAFAREGIQFARPQVIVQMPPGVEHPEAARAAALTALESMSKTDEPQARAS
ncbi:mechanosensitive ion channel family protein [Microvirga sp. GCM10011540]|uniref:mechanosensitive ion channel family protein n=1 Tax=Microvirga sp. GCM10011540 TaxID=3317338 RepID=UPI00361955A5